MARTGRRRFQLGILFAGLIAAIILLTSGAGWLLLTYGEGRIDRIDAFAGLTSRPSGSDGAVTYLVVGSDTRQDLTEAERDRFGTGTTEGRRSDTMMLVHVPEDRGSVAVVSLPRDSLVTVAGHGQQKLNAAYAFGGPSLAIKTIEDATGVRIDHYVEINFAGFADVVDALGGVEVCTPEPITDEYSGLDLPAGTTRLDGQAALSYVRARHFDPNGDLGRMERQQEFLGAMLRQATGSGLLLNPVRLTAFVNAALDTVVTDPGVSRSMVVDLANRVRQFSPDHLTFVTVPVSDPNHHVDGLGSTMLWDQEAARELFTALERDEPLPGQPSAADVPATAESSADSSAESSAESAGSLTARASTGPTTGATAAPSAEATAEATAETTTGESAGELAEESATPPAEIRVRVFNGAGVPGLATRVTEDLDRAGYQITDEPADAETMGATTTVVRYDSRQAESVGTLQAALPDARFEAVEGLGSIVEVVAGSSYAGLVGDRSSPEQARPDEDDEDEGAPIATKSAAENPCG